MKDLDLWVFISVFQEMLGPFLWLLIGLAVSGLTLFLAIVLRERGLSSRRLVWAELVGIVGGVIALLIMWLVTHSGIGDAGGPIDWVLIAAIWTVGAIGTAILAYVALSLFASGDASARQGGRAST
ncbi:DUF5368 domain-containing protein [Phreatobacter sp.]|uniref:DUF5368 domain-containing protein n=1 Tax=Phreatobacter sp. TaxID=1966341 RepID=UPI0025FA3598|nr:DUF5368 domain-containing protein [Phreatobacter sp.]